MKKILVYLSLPLLMAFCCAIGVPRPHKTPEPVVKELETIAGEYQQYELADSEYHHTLTYCEPYVTGRSIPYQAYQMSRSHQMTLMGNKLYRLWVKNMAAYPDHNDPNAYGLTQPAGQVVVKESWAWDTVYVSDGPAPQGIQLGAGTYLVPTERRLLFIMYKTASREYKTDKGWVYGIYDIPGRKVLEGGVITSCHSCHKREQDFVFGINF